MLSSHWFCGILTISACMSPTIFIELGLYIPVQTDQYSYLHAQLESVLKL